MVLPTFRRPWIVASSQIQQGRNAVFLSIIARLGRLSELPITPVFVFDGNQREHIKRGIKQNKNKEIFQVSEIKKILAIYGFPWLQVQIIFANTN